MRFKLGFLLVGICLHFIFGYTHTAEALGRPLGTDAWFRSGPATCGLVRGRHVPGRFVRGIIFISHLEARRNAEKKSKTAIGINRAKLLVQAAKFNKKLRNQKAFCALGPNPNATPTPNPGPGGGLARKWTVMVYMAADNNLAREGVGDIDEMEIGGGSTNEVQWIVQAEFSPDHLAQVGLSTPGSFNRPNYNTFLYPVIAGNSIPGPDGPAIDIGNRTMTDPNDLAAFISWSRQNYPAQNYALIVWNHGGGFIGLLQDETNTGGKLLSLQELRQALSAGPKLNVIDFDMCLMGGYETLAAVEGLADYVVAAQEVVPGEGNPYDLLVQSLRQNPNMTPAQVSVMIAQRFHESYSDGRVSTTISAYDMAQFSNFENLFSQFSSAWRNGLGGLRPSIVNAAGNAQRFEDVRFKDIKDLLDKSVGQGQPTSQINAVKQSLESPSFRLINLIRSGTSQGANPVNNSNGLSITLPSFNGDDTFTQSGPASLSNYQTQLPNRQWTSFVQDYMAGGAEPQGVSVDLGANRPEWYLVWPAQAFQFGVEIDMVILEPDGFIYIPGLGSVTPNGTMTPDSIDTELPFEGYAFRQFVDPGTYYLMAAMNSSPPGLNTPVDVAFRSSPAGAFSSLYSPNFPTLNTSVSWTNDFSLSLAEIFAGAYSDYKVLASWCLGPGCPPGFTGGTGLGIKPEFGLASPAELPAVTEAQMRKLSAILADGPRVPRGDLRAMVEAAYSSNPARRFANPSGYSLGTDFFWDRGLR